MKRRLTTGLIAAVASAALMVAGCSSNSDNAGDKQTTSSSTHSDEGASDSETTESGGVVTLLAHESFVLSDELKEAFTKETGYTLTLAQPGDSGQVLSQAILTKDDPIADVIFGVDNTFASRGIKEDIFVDYDSPALPEAAEALRLNGSHALTPIDQGEVCINYDMTWFKDKGISAPTSIDDLVKPEYKDLTVVMNPATSSPGLAFLFATIGKYGEDGYLDYWSKLKANGVSVSNGWSDAYEVEYTASADSGTRPIMVSYSTSPAAELDEDGNATTAVLADSCFRQVEYAAVLANAKNVEGAHKVIDFLLSDEVQKTFPTEMYVYPVSPAVELPESWEKFGALSDNPIEVDPQKMDENRKQWIEQWTETVVG